MSPKVFCAVVAVVALVVMGLSTIEEISNPHRAEQVAPEHGIPRSEKALNTQLRAPLSFVANTGSLDERVAFWLPGERASVYLTDAGLTYRLVDPPSSPTPSSSILKLGVLAEEAPAAAAQAWVVRQEFLGAALVRPVATEASSTRFSFFTGPSEQWRSSVPAAATVTYQDLWPGVDARYSGDGQRLKYEFTLAPGVDPATVRLAYRGAGSVTLTPDGDLQVDSPAGGFTDDAPTAYQVVGGMKKPVAVSYALGTPEADGAQPYGFNLGRYDPALPLVIDPATIVYAGFIGGTQGTGAYSIAVDAAGAAYVTGYTDSQANFPTAVGPDLTYTGESDAFVAKVAPDGTSLVYAGFIGGGSQDEGRGIAVDATGAAYIVGRTFSTDADFPTTVGPDLSANGYIDAFVAKVSPDGASLLYAGFIGGVSSDEGNAIGVDASGAAYVTGTTYSTYFVTHILDENGNPDWQGDFPVEGGPDSTYNGGESDAFVAKIAPDGSGLDYAGYIGGSEYFPDPMYASNGRDEGRGIAVDGTGAAYVTGFTDSKIDFPVTVGPDLTFNGTSENPFVAKIAPDGSGLDYAGFIGEGLGHGIAVDIAGAAYVTGVSGANFPVSVGPDLTFNGGGDAFVAKVVPDGAGLAYSGFIGGSGNDYGLSIDLDATGAAYVAGITNSTEATFPTLLGPDLTANGFYDAFVAKVSAIGTSLVYAGFIGGDGPNHDQGGGLDEAYGIAVDAAGAAYVAGLTLSNDPALPATVGPDLTRNGVGDAFVAKISPAGSTTPPAPPQISVSDTAVKEGDGGTSTLNFTLLRTGDLASPSTLRYRTADGTARADADDYVGVKTATLVTFPAGAHTASVMVAVKGDTRNEAHESLNIELSEPANSTLADTEAVGVITNDDGPGASLAVADMTVVEADTGATPSAFVLSRSGATTETVSVKATVVDRSAVAGVDYTTSAPVTVTFGVGETSKTVPFSVVGDTADEPNETLALNLTKPVNATIADVTGIVTIVDDDGSPAVFPPSAFLSVDDVAVLEGDEATTDMEFMVSRAGDTTGTSTVNVATGDATALSSGDYEVLSPTPLVFSPGDQAKLVTVRIGGDTTGEAHETLTLQLSGATGAVVADNSGVGTITNDDGGSAQLSVTDVVVGEGGTGDTSPAAFLIRRDGDATEEVRITVGTASGTATAGSDYAAVPATVVIFAPGVTERTVLVHVGGDVIDEPDEMFIIKMSNPLRTIVADDTAVATIIDDD